MLNLAEYSFFSPMALLGANTKSRVVPEHEILKIIDLISTISLDKWCNYKGVEHCPHDSDGS
jgi:hypothetical protein